MEICGYLLEKVQYFNENLMNAIINFLYNQNMNLPATNTVGRMGEINPKSNSSKFCFRTFYSIVNTPTKKNSQNKTPGYLPVFWYLPSKSKLWRKRWSFLAAEGSTLEPNISDSVWIIYSIYILIRKVF
jgi:hypothetical protein